MTAIVDGIFVSPERAQPLVALRAAHAIAHRGLEEDRYARNAGTFSKPREDLDAGRDVTLIAAETIDDVARETGLSLSDGRHRRNLVTRGLAMSELPTNAYLVIGPHRVVLRVDRTCPPCGHLERLVPGSLAAMLHRGGLRTTVMRGGTLRIGDEVAVLTRRDVVAFFEEATYV